MPKAVGRPLEKNSREMYCAARVAGDGVQAAAKKAGVARGTGHTWERDPRIQRRKAELRDALESQRITREDLEQRFQKAAETGTSYAIPTRDEIRAILTRDILLLLDAARGGTKVRKARVDPGHWKLLMMLGELHDLFVKRPVGRPKGSSAEHARNSTDSLNAREQEDAQEDAAADQSGPNAGQISQVDSFLGDFDIEAGEGSPSGDKAK